MKRLFLVFALIFAGQSYGKPASALVAADTSRTLMLLMSEWEGIEIYDEGGGFLDQIREFLDESYAFLLENFDYNNNGRIDFGPELRDSISEVNSIIVSFLDRVGDGKLARIEIRLFFEELFVLLRDEAVARACEVINEEAEKAGPWLPFRPVLKYLSEQCRTTLTL